MPLLSDIKIDPKEFGIFLRLKRKTRKISQKELSKKIGMGQPGISKIEHGGCKDLHLTTIVLLLNGIGVSIQEIYSFFVLQDIEQNKLYETISLLEWELRKSNKTNYMQEQKNNKKIEKLNLEIRNLKIKLRGKKIALTKVHNIHKRNKILLNSVRSINKKELINEVNQKDEIISDLQYENKELTKEIKDMRKIIFEQKEQLELLKAEVFRFHGLEY